MNNTKDIIEILSREKPSIIARMFLPYILSTLERDNTIRYPVILFKIIWGSMIEFLKGTVGLIFQSGGNFRERFSMVFNRAMEDVIEKSITDPETLLRILLAYNPESFYKKYSDAEKNLSLTRLIDGAIKKKYLLPDQLIGLLRNIPEKDFRDIFGDDEHKIQPDESPDTLHPVNIYLVSRSYLPLKENLIKRYQEAQARIAIESKDLIISSEERTSLLIGEMYQTIDKLGQVPSIIQVSSLETILTLNKIVKVLTDQMIDSLMQTLLETRMLALGGPESFHRIEIQNIFLKHYPNFAFGSAVPISSIDPSSFDQLTVDKYMLVIIPSNHFSTLKLGVERLI